MLSVTATDLPRLLTCNGSRLMGGYTPPVNVDTTVRDEGNAAHWLVETFMKSDELDLNKFIGVKAYNGIFITDKMVNDVLEYVRHLINAQIEVKTTFDSRSVNATEQVPFYEIKGRSDGITHDQSTSTLYVSDLKYGWSIVEPEMNWTLIAHAIGFMANNRELRIKNYVFTIYQPRSHHPLGRVRSWTIDVYKLRELMDLLDHSLRSLTDTLQTSDFCNNCPFLTVCPAFNKAELNGIEASEQAFVDNIDNATLSFKLDQLKRVTKITEQAYKAYKSEALHRVKKGGIIKNYSVDTDLANTSWKAHATPELVQIMTGKDLTKKQLITPTQAIASGANEDVVASLTERKQKGFKLVRIDANEKASKMFNPTNQKGK
jgi:hypothetical protein